MDIDLPVLEFDVQKWADEALKTIKGLSREWGFALLNAAVLTKDQKGRHYIKETSDIEGYLTESPICPQKSGVMRSRTR